MIKTDLNGVLWTGFNWLRIERSEGLLWTRQWFFWFHTKPLNSWIDLQLAASRTGLNSTELIKLWLVRGGGMWSGIIQSAVFWNIMPCGCCKNRRFGGMCRLHLQGRKIQEKENASSWLTDWEPKILHRLNL
jgi:hypothetical protein